MLAVVTGVATGPRGHGPYYLLNKEENWRKRVKKGEGKVLKYCERR